MPDVIPEVMPNVMPNVMPEDMSEIIPDESLNADDDQYLNIISF